MRTIIGEIVENSFTVQSNIYASYLHERFHTNSSLEGVVVVQDDKPIGLIMKSKFFQKLSIKYGFDVFMQRSVDLVMDQTMLIVDYFTSITEVGKIAMEREQERIYDYVIVEKHGKLHGVVSIRDLIIRLSEVQIEIAKFSNPLSGLPGNRLINATLSNAIGKDKPFTVLYFDLDNFKAFNDKYGFSEGDRLLVETAYIIRDTIGLKEDGFVGHIGGDDYIAVLPHHNFTNICERIIAAFEENIVRFYNEEDWERGYIKAMNRQNQPDIISLVSLSIAVIHNKSKEYQTIERLSREAAEVKQACKALKGSVYLENKLIVT